MLVKKKVTITAIVTEEFKERLVTKLQEALEEVTKAEQQLEIQGKRYLSKLEQKEPSKASEFAKRLERQRYKNGQVKARLAEELSRARELTIGAEYQCGRTEGFADIRIGDNLNERLRPDEIVIKDGIVVEIRSS